MSKLLEQIKLEHQKMEGLMNKHSEHGACDSEPDGVYQVGLARAFKGEFGKLPRGVDAWQLFSQPGAGLAARQMTSQLNRVMGLISRVTLKERKALEEWLRGIIWRVEL